MANIKDCMGKVPGGNPALVNLLLNTSMQLREASNALSGIKTGVDVGDAAAQYEQLVDSFQETLHRLNSETANRHITEVEMIAHAEYIIATTAGKNRGDNLTGDNVLLGPDKEQIKAVQEWLASIFGGMTYDRDSLDAVVHPFAGVRQIEEEIGERIIREADLDEVLFEVSSVKAGGMRIGIRESVDNNYLRAIYDVEGKNKNIPATIKKRMARYRAAIKKSLENANEAAGYQKYLVDDVLPLPRSAAELQTMGRNKFKELITSGNFTTHAGAEVDAKMADEYFDFIVNNNPDALHNVETPHWLAPNNIDAEIRRYGFKAKNWEAHSEFLKAAGAHSAADALLIRAKNVGRQEALVRAFGANPRNLADSLVRKEGNQGSRIFAKVFADKQFREEWDKAMDLATGLSDTEGFDSAVGRRAYESVDMMRRISQAAALKNAAQAGLADSPYRARLAKAFSGNNFYVELVKDYGAVLQGFFRTHNMNREAVGRYGAMLDSETQDIFGGPIGQDGDPTLNSVGKIVQNGIGGWHGFTFFRQMNNASQIRAMNLVNENLRNAFKQSKTFAGLKTEQKELMKGMLLIDERTYDHLAKKAKLGDESKINIFDGVDLDEYYHQRLQVAFRNFKRIGTGRSTLWAQASSPMAKLTAAKRGTWERATGDLLFPFLSPILNQVSLNYTKVRQIERALKAAKDNPGMLDRIPPYANEFLLQTIIPLMLYGHMRMQLSHYARTGEWMEYDTSERGALSVDNIMKSAMYGAFPVLSFFYDFQDGEIGGAKLGDLTIRMPIDLMSLTYDVMTGEKVEWDKVIRRRLPASHIGAVKGLGIIDEDWGR